jgi:hypothetical protein
MPPQPDVASGTPEMTSISGNLGAIRAGKGATGQG